MKGLDILEQFVNTLQVNPLHGVIDREQIDPQLYMLADSLNALGDTIRSLYRFSIELSNGNIDVSVGRKDYMTGPLKDLQSTLRHIVWQTNRVAEGDYKQRMEFLGEFSDSFNKMIEQLKMREQLQKENVELQLQIVINKEEFLAEQLEQQVGYNRSMAQKNQNLASFRHDVKNHILAVRNLLQAGKYDDALVYLDNIETPISNANITLKTDNYMMDALLSAKISAAKEKGISVDSRLKVKPHLSVSDFNWCVLLGNALDNAIEACMKVEPPANRKMSVIISCHGDMLNITVSNTCAAVPEINEQTGLYKTTKETKTGHGMGLSNIKKIVEEYNGSLETEIKDGVFTLFILLCGVTSKQTQ